MSVELHRLPNGLRVVVEPMPGMHSASIGLYITAGGRHERPEQNGVAHFLEHMAFKGTPTRTARRIAEDIEDVGGYINAYTGKEMTAYYARVLEPDVEMARRSTPPTTSSSTGCRRPPFRSNPSAAPSSVPPSGWRASESATSPVLSPSITDPTRSSSRRPGRLIRTGCSPPLNACSVIWSPGQRRRARRRASPAASGG
jgi:hypothetical protein